MPVRCLQGARLRKLNYVSQDYLTKASNVYCKIDTTHPKVLPLSYRPKKQVTLPIAHLIKNVGTYSILSKHT